jgi:hypothetical protein
MNTSFSARKAAVVATVQAQGGTVEAMYFNSSSSDWDWMVIMDTATNPSIQAKAQILASGSYESIIIEHVQTAEEADGQGSVQHETA